MGYSQPFLQRYFCAPFEQEDCQPAFIAKFLKLRKDYLNEKLMVLTLFPSYTVAQIIQNYQTDVTNLNAFMVEEYFYYRSGLNMNYRSRRPLCLLVYHILLGACNAYTMTMLIISVKLPEI